MRHVDGTSERRPIERDYSLPGMEHELSLLGRCFVCNDTGIMGQPCRRCDHGSTYVDMADEDEWSYHNPTPPRYVHGSWTTETPSPRSDDTPPDGTNTRSPWMGEVTITNPQEPEGSEQNPIELLGEEDAKEELLFHSSDDKTPMMTPAATKTATFLTYILLRKTTRNPN